MGYQRCDRCKVWRGGWDIQGAIMQCLEGWMGYPRYNICKVGEY